MQDKRNALGRGHRVEHDQEGHADRLIQGDPVGRVSRGAARLPAGPLGQVRQRLGDPFAHVPLAAGPCRAEQVANPFAGGPEAPVEIHLAFDGDDPQHAARAIDPIRRLGTVTGDDIALEPYADTLTEGMTPPPGIQFVPRSAFVGKESVPEVLQILAEVRASERSPVITVRSVGGAVSRVPDDATAYAHRHAELMVVTMTAGPKPAVEAARPDLDAIWERLAPHVNGAYANFLASATEEDVAAIYPTQTHRRLAAVKRQYDPGNLFARNHNIRPQ